MLVHKSLSTWLCVTLAAGTISVPLPAQARFPTVANSLVARAADPAAVLGLEGSDEAASDSLTEALRRAFAQRGYGSQEKLSLAEVRLAMGCQGYDPQCLGEAGDSLSVEKLIYGSLEPKSGGNYALELRILDVEQRVEESKITTPLTAGDLSAANIDATAAEIVNSLFPEPTDPEIPVTPVDDEPVDDGIEPEPIEETRESNLVWGKYNPRPTWKWAGFGAGIGLVALGAATGVGTGVRLQILNDDLRSAADASLTDCEKDDGGIEQCGENETDFFTGNDVDPDLVDDICDAGSEVLGVNEKGQDIVRNERIYHICEEAGTLEKVNIAGWATLGAGVVVTAIFTTLLFVHRREPGVDRALRRGLHLTATPTRDGGFMVGGGMKF